MKRATVSRFLAAHLVVVWAAVFVQFDEFPLTWVPMYAVFQPTELLSYRVVMPENVKRGFRATHRDGSTGWITQRDLNISKRHFRRLYRQRPFQKRPLERWDYRILRSVNRTLGLAPDDPKFIVRLEADIERWWLRKTDLEVVEREARHASLEWNDEKQGRWQHEGR